MGIGILGPLELDGAECNLGLRDRIVLETLALRHELPVSPDTLADALWGEDPPSSWAKVVQGCVVRLRKALGADTIETSTQGYRLQVHRDHLDHLRFEHLLDRARQLTAAGEPERAAYLLREALELWRGQPFAELVDWAPGRAEAERLVELRHDAEDLLTEALLLAGRHREAIAPAVRLVHDEPMRERRWGLLALAQYQGGRQADALQTPQQARRVLVDELGLDPGDDLVGLERAILNQDPALAVAAALPEGTAECPYLGLVAYDVRDGSTFFGREEATAACLRRLDEAGVLAVVGPSGSGKSSVARAGVAAALERDGRQVQVVNPGATPVAALRGLPSRPGAVLVVDQCEEALAVAEGSPERAEFFATLVRFARGHRLVITLRADRLGELSPHPEFARLVERGLHLLGPMTEVELRHAIEGPAAQAGLRIEPGLVDLLVREVAGEPAALPLLSHVLRQTWNNREGNTLTVQGYAATGGVREAVAQSAEGVFRGLDPVQQTILHDLMLRLVAPDEGGDPVRLRVPLRAVAGDPQRVELVEQLLGARLLATDAGTVAIAHESLAVAWPRLRSWLDEDIDGLRVLRHLTVAAESWDELGRPDSELYRGVRQARAAEWHQRSDAALTQIELDFLHDSTTLADKEQRATRAQVRRERALNQRLRLGLAAVAALLAASIVAGATAVTARNHADDVAAAAAQQAVTADARRLGAEALRSDALDRALLLAVAGVSLDDSDDTRTNLLATLDRAPALMGGARSAGRVLHQAVNPATGQVAVMAADDIGLELYDGTTLHRAVLPERLVGGSVVARPDGRGYAVTTSADLVRAGAEPPVVLLDDTGARSAVQLGGVPARHHVLDLGFPLRWYLGFSPTSRWFVVSLVPLSGVGPTLTAVWDMASPSRPEAVLELGDVGSAPTVSRDGRTLYTGTYSPNDLPDGGSLLLTDLRSGKARRTLASADLDVRRLDDVLALSPDGRTLAIGAGVEVVLVDTVSLRARAHLSGRGGIRSLAYSADGSHLAAGGDHLMVWDLRGDHPLEVLAQDGEADDPAFSPDATTLYSKTVAGLVQAWDLAGTRRFLAVLPGDHLDWSDPIGRFSPDRRKVAYAANTPKFRVRDVATGRLGPEVDPPMAQGDYIDIAWHPDSRLLNITSGDPVVRTWDSTTGRQVAQRRLGPPGSREGAAVAFFSLDGKLLLVGTTEGRLHTLDARTLVPTHAPIQVYEDSAGGPAPQAVDAFAPSGDHRTVWTNDRIVDYVAATVRPMPDLGFSVVALYPSPDGSRLLVDTGPTGIGLLDARTMQWISRPSAAQAGLLGYQTVWSDDGSLVASTADGRLTQWDGHRGTRLGTTGVKWPGDPAFSADDEQLFLADSGGAVLRWDLAPAAWVAAACRLAGRPLTEQEWRTYLPGRPPRPVCPS